MDLCIQCRSACQVMQDSLCADCYWDNDSYQKCVQRSNSIWIFSRAYSAAKVILGKSHEDALELAAESVRIKFTSK